MRVSDGQWKDMGREVGEVPLSAHEHVPAVDGDEVHLHDGDADEARKDLVAIRTNPAVVQ
jgi:hypothetical protein